MVVMWINSNLVMYQGDCAPGDRAATTCEVAAYESAKVKTARRIEIEAALLEIDTKRIRPLAEGDTTYLDELNKQAVALRDEWRGLTP